MTSAPQRSWRIAAVHRSYAVYRPPTLHECCRGGRAAPCHPLVAAARANGCSALRQFLADHLEAGERVGAEAGGDRRVGGVAAAGHQDAADARLVVAGVEDVPAVAEIG